MNLSLPSTFSIRKCTLVKQVSIFIRPSNLLQTKSISDEKDDEKQQIKVHVEFRHYLYLGKMNEDKPGKSLES